MSVAILGVGLAGVMDVYRAILGSYGRARFSIGGLSLLEEKMIDQELQVRGRGNLGGSDSGAEGSWQWSTRTAGTAQEGWYEIKGQVQGKGKVGTLTLFRYVRP